MGADLDYLTAVQDLLPGGRLDKDEYWHLCPFHPEKKPSFSVNVEKGVFSCLGCGESGNFRQLVEVLGYDWEEILERYGNGVRPSKKRRDKSKRTPDWERIWLQADLQGPVALRYLHSRGLPFERLPEFFREYRTSDGKIILLVKLINEKGEICGFQRIFLTEDGRKAPEGKKAWPGSKLKGAFALIGVEPEELGRVEILGVAEGPETGLAVHLATGWPVLVAISAPNLPMIRYPQQAKILFFADRDKSEAGEREARKAVKKLRKRGQKAVYVLPPGQIPEGSKSLDFLDVYVSEGPEVIRKLAEKALRECEEALNKTKKRGRPSKSDLLLRLLEDEGIFLFHDQYQQSWVRVRINDHYENLPLESSLFRDFLAHLLWRKTGETISQDILKNAIAVLSARARFEGPQLPLFYRAARHEDALWIDLGSGDFSAIKVGPEGWRIVPSAKVPVIFRRYPHMSALPTPRPGNEFSVLREILPIGQDDWLLLSTWILTVLIPDIARPWVLFVGAQGAGKTLAAEVLRALLDPSESSSLVFPSNTEALVQILAQNFLPLFDNVRSIPSWGADILCQAITSGHFSRRRLYTDDETVHFSFLRTFVVTSIGIPSIQPDLLDRCLIFEIQRIPEEERLPKRQLWQRFEEIKAAVFSQILDGLAYVLRRAPEIEKERKTFPRLADWFCCGLAAAEFLGFGQEAFEKILKNNLKKQHLEIIENDPVALVLCRFLEENFGFFEGTPSELFKSCIKIAKETEGLILQSLPRTAHHFSRKLRSLAPVFRQVGISLEERRTPQRRIVRVELKDDPGHKLEAKGEIDHEPRKQREFLI